MTLFSNLRRWFTQEKYRKVMVLAVYRVLALFFALVQIFFYSSPPSYVVPRMELIAATAAYTILKLAQPLRWYKSSGPQTIFIILDVLVCASLVVLTNSIQSPFLLYSLTPVLTSALFFPARETIIVSTSIGLAVLLSFLTPIQVSTVDTLSKVSNFAIYIVTLLMGSILPYVINTQRGQQLRSEMMLSERKRLAREIHDSLCQTVYGLRWWFEMLYHNPHYFERHPEKGQELESLLKNVEQEARGSIESLRRLSNERPFLTQIKDYLTNLEGETGIKSQLEAEPVEPAVDDVIKLELLEICQEALRNVRKHSKASGVTLSLFPVNDHLHVCIADDGQGFESEKMVEGRGLSVMKERAESVGGTLELFSSRGRGTRIKIDVPQKLVGEV